MFSLDKKLNYSNLTKEERQAIYPLRDDTSIFIKKADESTGIGVWDKEDYLSEARTNFEDKNAYQELKGNIKGPLEKIIKIVLRNARYRKDISDETLHYFLVNNPRLGKVYFVLKIHRIFYNAPRRLLYLILSITPKTHQLFLNIILSRSQKKLNHILRTPMAFYVN